jgi:hypothetical protein
MLNNFSMRKSIAVFLFSVPFVCFSQNVGIGTTLPPSEKLDVNGNINVAGTIKANGTDGTPGQVLMKNTSGNLAWGDMCEYKNFVSLTSTAGGTWTVPADVTKILVEVWGAGGGGNFFAGGGGGGYIKAHFTVTPGSSVAYDVGAGGAGAVSASGTSGDQSTCTIGAIVLTSSGGQGALYLTAVNGQAGVGAGASASGGYNNYIVFQGSSGESQKRNYHAYNATTYYESGEAGRGGNGGNTVSTGGLGQYYLYNTTGATLVYRNGNSATGLRPGGGGASGVQYGASLLGGGTGANGLVVIHY